jgi:hypothetical protein
LEVSLLVSIFQFFSNKETKFSFKKLISQIV